MITLYLDHQIYSFLKNRGNTEFFKGPSGRQKMEAVQKLHDFLTNHKADFLIFYSHAHLLDLSSDKSGNNERLLNDLKYRAKWAENNYLTFHDKENTTDYILEYPEIMFEPYWEQQSTIDFSDLFDLSGLEGFIEEDKLNELKQQIANLQNLTLPGLDSFVSEETHSHEDYTKMKEIIGFMNGGNFIDIMNSFIDMSNRFENEKGFYKSLRNMITSGIQKIKLHDVPINSLETNFMADLANIDLNGPEKELFVREKLLDMVKKQWANREKDKEPTIFDMHYHSYIMLDMMGIEIEKASIARNMLHDAHHSFYGGHAEIVISDDKQFRAKSRLLYKLFGLSTQIFSIEEFMYQSFSFKLEEINSFSDLIIRTQHDIKTGFISAVNMTAIVNNVQKINASMKYLHYFNKILIVNEEGKDYIVFRHEEQTYLRHYPFKVIERITNKSIEIFGLDDARRGMYKWESENAEINEHTWLGRNWTSDKMILSLQTNPKGEHLQLVLETI